MKRLLVIVLICLTPFLCLYFGLRLLLRQELRVCDGFEVIAIVPEHFDTVRLWELAEEHRWALTICTEDSFDARSYTTLLTPGPIASAPVYLVLVNRRPGEAVRESVYLFWVKDPQQLISWCDKHVVYLDDSGRIQVGTR